MSRKIPKKLARDVQAVVEKGLEKALLPMQQGNKIFIGNIVIQNKDNRFFITDGSTKQQLGITNFKHSALALAKNHLLNRSKRKTILELDDQLTKHYMDGVFYKNTIKKARNSHVVFAAETRLDITKAQTQKCIKEIERHIFS